MKRDYPPIRVSNRLGALGQNQTAHRWEPAELVQVRIENALIEAVAYEIAVIRHWGHREPAPLRRLAKVATQRGIRQAVVAREMRHQRKVCGRRAGR